MKFKQNQELKQDAQENQIGMNKDLYNGFIDLIQFEYNKLNAILSAKFYFYEKGQMTYKKFFTYLYEQCDKTKKCLVLFLVNNLEKLPEFTTPSLNDFSDLLAPFELLANMEDVFEEKLLNLINIAFENKEWKAFYYLLKQLDTIDHICCRALEAAKANVDVTTLIPCEQHISAK